MKSLVKLLFLIVVMLSISSCNNIDGSASGEYTVLYYGNIVGTKLESSNYGYVWIDVDVDSDGNTDFDVILANSFVAEMNELPNSAIRLQIVSGSKKSFNGNNWYVVKIITQPYIKDYLELDEEILDTTEIIVR